MSAGVVPQDAGPERLIGCVEQRCPMHLAAEADPVHSGKLAALGKLRQRRLRRRNPVGRGLLGPAGTRTRDAQRHGCLADRPLVGIDHDGLQAGSTEINSEIGHRALFNPPASMPCPRTW